MLLNSQNHSFVHEENIYKVLRANEMVLPYIMTKEFVTELHTRKRLSKIAKKSIVKVLRLYSQKAVLFESCVTWTVTHFLYMKDRVGMPT